MRFGFYSESALSESHLFILLISSAFVCLLLALPKPYKKIKGNLVETSLSGKHQLRTLGRIASFVPVHDGLAPAVLP